MKSSIENSINESIKAIESLNTEENIEFINNAAAVIINCYNNGGKLLIAGNGGSLCDAMHFAEELTGFYRSRDRRAFPAIAFSDPGHITCVANDIGYSEVFKRFIEAHGRFGDVFVVLTTSGNSINLVKAVEKAKEMKLTTIGFLGKDGGMLKGKTDLELIIKNFKYSDRIQEAHMAAIHIIIEVIENACVLEKAFSRC